MTKIKICGLTRKEDIEHINKVKPEYIGFVFFEKSIRYLTADKAEELKAFLDPDIKAVGVFLDNSLEIVKELVEAGTIDMIQLRGKSMGEDFIAKIKDFTDLPVIRAFTVESEDDIRLAMASTADYVLLDSGRGGTGTTFDWNCIRNMDRPYFLAGGLNPGNVSKAVERFHPFAVDVSSGVETDKLKDFSKIDAFIENVKAAAIKSH